MYSTPPWAIALVLLCALVPTPTRAAAPPASPAEIEALIAKLDDDHFHVRRRADNELRQRGAVVLPVLRDHLARTHSVEARLRLTSIIDDLTADQRVPELVRQLGDTSDECRASADWQLRRYGKVVVPLLKKELTPTLDAQRRKKVERLISELATRR